jgi:Leucine-rich repeat (LRR) protein
VSFLRTLMTTAAVSIFPLVPANASTVNICDRSPEIRAEIVRQTNAISCELVASESLNAVVAIKLDISGTRELQSSDLQGLLGLETIWLSNSHITAIPNGYFSGLASLKSVDISHTQIQTLPEGVFENLPKLERVLLEVNAIKKIPARAFANSKSLELVMLSYNQISEIEPDAFVGVANLEQLFLAGNQLGKVLNPLTGLTSVWYLDLSENRIETLPDGVFRDLTKLTTLFVSENPIQNISVTGVFGPSQFSSTAEVHLDGFTLPLEKVTELRELLGARGYITH